MSKRFRAPTLIAVGLTIALGSARVEAAAKPRNKNEGFVGFLTAKAGTPQGARGSVHPKQSASGVRDTLLVAAAATSGPRGGHSPVVSAERSSPFDRKFSKLVKDLERRVSNLEGQIGRDEGIIAGAIKQLSRLHPELGKGSSRFFTTRTSALIFLTNRLTTELQQLSSDVNAFSSLAPGRAGKFIAREERLDGASAPLYSRVNVLAKLAGLERQVATPFAP